MRGRARGRSSGPLFRSLRLRMGVSHGLVLALILVLMGGTGYLLLARSLNRSATASVVEAAREATERVSSSRSPVNIRPDDDVPSATTIRVAAFLNDGRVVSDPGRRPSWLRPQREPTTTLSVLGERVRIATVPLRQDGRVIGQVVAARSLAPEDRLLDRVRLLLLLGGLMAVLLGMLAGWVLAGRAAKPVRRAYEAQASFASDASHEFRTPLAFVRSGVEVLAEHDQELGDEVLREVTYLAGLTDRLLTLARSDSKGLSLETRPLDLGPVCERAVDRAHRVLSLRADVVRSKGCVAMGELGAGRVERSRALAFGHPKYVVTRDVEDLGLGVDEPPDQPRAGDPVRLRSFPGHPTHRRPSAVAFTRTLPSPGRRCARPRAGPKRRRARAPRSGRRLVSRSATASPAGPP